MSRQVPRLSKFSPRIEANVLSTLNERNRNKIKKNCLILPPTQEGGGVSKVTTGLVLTASMTSRLASVTFKMTAKVVVDEADKIVEFRMDNLINFIRFSDNKIPIVIEIRNLVPLLDETFRSVMNFNGSFLSSSKSAEQSYQPVRLSRASAQQVGGV